MEPQGPGTVLSDECELVSGRVGGCPLCRAETAPFDVEMGVDWGLDGDALISL